MDTLPLSMCTQTSILGFESRVTNFIELLWQLQAGFWLLPNLILGGATPLAVQVMVNNCLFFPYPLPQSSLGTGCNKSMNEHSMELLNPEGHAYSWISTEPPKYAPWNMGIRIPWYHVVPNVDVEQNNRFTELWIPESPYSFDWLGTHNL